MSNYQTQILALAAIASSRSSSISPTSELSSLVTPQVLDSLISPISGKTEMALADWDSQSLLDKNQSKDIARPRIKLAIENGATQSYINQYCDVLRSKYSLPGLWVCIIKKDTILCQYASGSNGLPQAHNASIDDQLMIGSISKIYCGFLVARLVTEGVVRWDTSVRAALPDLAEQYPNHPSIDATIEQLLSHRSGLRRSNFQADKYGKTPGGYRKAVIENLFTNSPVGTPGQVYEYSNGTDVIASILERVTNKSYAELLQEYVYKPMGMTTAQFGPSEKAVLGNFLESNGNIVPGNQNNMPQWMNAASGSIESSIVDLAKFGAFYSSSGLSVPSLSKALSCPFGNGSTIGALWWEGAAPDWFMHNGSTGRGEYSWLGFNPKSQTAIAVYYNLNRRDGSLRVPELELDLIKKIQPK
jgi:CubicO group peptidase (beta-lactamase class C family)